jgi:hypothetical protein
MSESEQLQLLQDFSNHIIILTLIAVFVAIIIAISRKSW